MQPTQPSQLTQPMQPTQPRQPTLPIPATTPRLATTPKLTATPALPITAPLARVPAEPMTAPLATVPAEPTTALEATVPAEPTMPALCPSRPTVESALVDPGTIGPTVSDDPAKIWHESGFRRPGAAVAVERCAVNVPNRPGDRSHPMRLLRAHRPRLRRPGLLLAAAIVAASLLIACGQSEPGGTTTSAPGPGSPPSGDGPVASTTPQGKQSGRRVPKLSNNANPAAVNCSAPPQGIFDATTLIGQPEQEAIDAATAQGCAVRVIERDGEKLAFTQDFRPDRINVVVADGVVERITTLG